MGINLYLNMFEDLKEIISRIDDRNNKQTEIFIL